MAYPVNESHAQLIGEAIQLLQRLGVSRMVGGGVPVGDGYLHLVPALHAIVDRLEKLEAHMGRVALQPKQEELAQPISNALTDELIRDLTDEQIDEIIAKRRLRMVGRL